MDGSSVELDGARGPKVVSGDEATRPECSGGGTRRDVVRSAGTCQLWVGDLFQGSTKWMELRVASDRAEVLDGHDV